TMKQWTEQIPVRVRKVNRKPKKRMTGECKNCVKRWSEIVKRRYVKCNNAREGKTTNREES
ncbi:hypothetical protein OS493_028770, partial [Desmophyllum pertusum]